MVEQLRIPEQNKVLIVGRVTRDVELRFTPSNQAVTSFNIASNRRYKDAQTGEWKDLPSFVQIVAWGKIAERCGERLKKGNAIFVEGRLQSRNWETKAGEKRYTLEVVADRVQFLTKTNVASPDSDVGDGDFVKETVPAGSNYKNVENSADNSGEIDEEIPF